MKNGLTLRIERDVEALGPEWDSLFAAGAGLQSSRAWLAATSAAAIPAGATPHLLALSDAHGPAILMPMLAGPAGRWGSLTTPYTCLYQPLLRTDPIVSSDGFRALGRYCRRWPMTRLEALDPDWHGLPSLQQGFASAGLAVRSFANFGNWHETLRPGTWDGYLEARPGELRETIRRRTRTALKRGAQLELARSEHDLAAALAAYEQVYARSWKQPEPFPDFNATLVRALAGTGVLRIALMRLEGQPIAAQYWSVVGGVATVLKLAHDETWKALSPGTVLTAATIRQLIEGDGVGELDFGRGDDPYKRGWAQHRRDRVGLLALDVRTVTGARALAVHDAGRLARLVRRVAAGTKRVQRVVKVYPARWAAGRSATLKGA